MYKKSSVLFIIMLMLTSCASQPQTQEMIDVLNKNIESLKTELNEVKEEVAVLKEDNEKLLNQPTLTYLSQNKDYVYYSEYVPNEMGPGTIITFITENEFIIDEGYAVYGYDEDVFKDLPADYERYPDPVKGMVVTYASDGLILKIIEP